MLNKLSMRLKIFIPTLTLVLIGFTIFSIFNYITTSNTLDKMSYNSLEQEADKISNEIVFEINKASIEVDTMSQMIQTWVNNKSLNRIEIQNQLETWAKNNPFLKGTWVDWVPEKFGDEQDKKERFTVFWARNEKGSMDLQDPYPWNEVENENYFVTPQKVKDLVMITPYIDEINGKKELLTSIGKPLYRAGEFVGVMGCDFSIKSITKTFENNKPFNIGNSRLITDEGKIAADVDEKNLNNLWPNELERKTISEKMKTNKAFYIEGFDSLLKQDTVKYFKPIKMGRSPFFWYYVSIVPKAAIKKATHKIIIYQSIAIIFALLTIATAVWLTVTYIAKEIEKVASNVENGAIEVDNVTSELNETQESLSTTTLQQAELVNQTSKAINKMTESIDQNGQKADESNKELLACQKQGEDGKAVTREMIQSIEQIKKSNEQMLKQIDDNFQKIENFVTIINQIQEKTNVINDIVFQTKLLAFNASVEAARAGEFGKGFSVVAEEVGNLATMSGEASKEITHIIDLGSKTIKDIINSAKSKNEIISRENVKTVYAGTIAAEKCEKVLSDISVQIERISMKSTQIKLASDNQNKDAQEINSAMGTLDEVTINNNEIGNKIGHTVVTLADQTKNLKNQVSRLNKIIKGA